MSVVFRSDLSARSLLFLVITICASLSPFALGAQDSCSIGPPLQSKDSWHFAVSGDSRNCGDVIMPAIAAGVQQDEAAFYWHLGDFRLIKDIDPDYKQAAILSHKPVSLNEYETHAWADFRESQIKPFAPVAVFLGIGNHELAPPKSRSEYLSEFSEWIDSPGLKCQRQKDNSGDPTPKTYYHWIRGGIDFINLDNAGPEGFDAGEMKWFENIVHKDRDDRAITTVVVGMHEALPESISRGHSMNQSPQGEQTGRAAYRELLKLQKDGHKKVYVLASHSHFFMDGTFNTEYWRRNGGVLPGWIIGTAGAVRYPLPPNADEANAAKTNVYGYLLATVNPAGEEPGTIRFEFRELKEDSVPGDVVTKFSRPFVHECFAGNSEAH